MLALTGKRIKTIDNLKPKDWSSLGLTKETRQVMDSIYQQSDGLDDFIKEMLGYTKTQFMANITADTVQLLMKMGIHVDGKPTVANYKKLLEDLLDAHPWLRHRNPAVCLAKVLYFQKLENDAAEKESYSESDEEEEEKPKKKKSKKQTTKKEPKKVTRLQRPSSSDDDDEEA